MKKILLLVVFLGLLGCNKNETQNIVKNSLKDPNSAEFRNINKSCGEVNAKNSYGGYIGFERFYISNNSVFFLDKDKPLAFELGWIAHCEEQSNLSDQELDNCVAIGQFAGAVISSKNAGVTEIASKNLVTANSNESKNTYNTLIENGYKNFTNQTVYAHKILKDCLSGKIQPPID